MKGELRLKKPGTIFLRTKLTNSPTQLRFYSSGISAFLGIHHKYLVFSQMGFESYFPTNRSFRLMKWSSK